MAFGIDMLRWWNLAIYIPSRSKLTVLAQRNLSALLKSEICSALLVERL
jgi:hypothetical protein